MSLTEIVVQGTLQSDGTVTLDEKPNLPPGRVTVVLRQQTLPALPQEGWWPYMQRARRELEAAGSHFMNEEEVNAYMEWLREGDQIDDLLRQADEERQRQEKP
jgi:hypothetical protein